MRSDWLVFVLDYLDFNTLLVFLYLFSCYFHYSSISTRVEARENWQICRHQLCGLELVIDRILPNVLLFVLGNASLARN